MIFRIKRDHRKIEINKVGVKNIRYPITVLDKAKGFQHTVASVNMFVDLPHRFKGTHMSRFVEILIDISGDICHQKPLKNFIRGQKEAESQDGSLGSRISLISSKRRSACLPKSKSLMEYICRFSGSSNEKRTFMLGLLFRSPRYALVQKRSANSVRTINGPCHGQPSI